MAQSFEFSPIGLALISIQVLIQKYPILFWSTTSVLGFGIVTYILLYAYVQLRYAQLPSVETLRHIQVEVPLRIYTHDGELLGEFGEIRRRPLNINQIPEQIIRAFTSAEDDEFFQHSGIDFSGLLRSAYVNIKRNAKAQGASTITMQLARNYFLSKEKTWRRKRDEVILASKIETEFSKNEIIELYLNKIYFGNRAYGLGAAAQVYYGKSVTDLNLPQIAMIAGLPQSPSRFNPIINPTRALDRRNYVLRRMHKLGFIDGDTYRTALTTADDAILHSQKVNVDAYYIAEMVRKEMRSRYGENINEQGFQVYTTIDGRMQEYANRAVRKGLLDYDRRHGYRGPLEQVNFAEYVNEQDWEEKISQYPIVNRLHPVLIIGIEESHIIVYHPEHGRITISDDKLAWALQSSPDQANVKTRNIKDVFRPGDLVYSEQKEQQWWLAQVPEVEAAFVSLSPKNGAIKALVGGFDFFKSKYNRATQALRQPGSNFKPFVYSAALEKQYTTASIINDAPIENEWWRPQNSDYTFEGPIPVRRALAYSKNMVAIRLLRDIGISYTVDYIRRFGFDTETLPNDLTLALGSCNVTPLKIAQGFSVFANGGYAVDPYLIKRIEDSRGKVLFKSLEVKHCDKCIPLVNLNSNLPPNEIQLVEEDVKHRLAPRVISEQNAYFMTSMLRDVISHGTGKGAKELNRNDLAGKTGTSNDQKDAWFTGYNADLAATIWVGFDQPKTLGHEEYGSRAALPIWIEFMRNALATIPESPLVMPTGITMVRIDPKTGKRACAGESDTVFEPFPNDKLPEECSDSISNPNQPAGHDNPFISS